MQRARRLAQQDVQAVFRFGQAGFECGNLRPGLLPVAARLLDVLAADEPGLGAPVGELQRLGLAGEVVAGNAEPDLPGAHLDVVQRHFGRQRHPGVVQARLGRFEVGLGRLDAAAHAAEHVELPARVEAGAEEIARVAAADLLARLAAAGAARCGHAGILPGGGYRAACAGLAQFRLRAAQIGAGLQGFIDQPDSSGSFRLCHHWPRSPDAAACTTGWAAGSSRVQPAGVSVAGGT